MVAMHEKVRCWFSNDTSKPEVIVYRICEGTHRLKAAFRSGMTSLQFMVVSARSVGWESNKAVTLMFGHAF